MTSGRDPAGPARLLTADRVASLSDTMFGVAMTLVVGTLLPSIQAHRGAVLDLLPAMRGELVTVVLSFAISARYWVAQQQRLAMSGTLTPWQIWLHLAFLFLVVLVPISCSLPDLAGSGARLGSVMIYGGHLALLALVNLLLWVGVHRTTAAHVQIMRSGLTFALFAASLVVGAARPDWALYVWLAVLAAPQLSRPLARLLFGAGHAGATE